MHRAGTVYGYTRVSIDIQDLISQLKQEGVGCEKIFRGKITGTTPTGRSFGRWWRSYPRGG